MDSRLKKRILKHQQSEITEYHVYRKLAKHVKHKHNRRVLERIGNEEKKHYEFWKKHTKQDVKPDYVKLCLYYLLSKIFGITFGVKMMERGETRAQKFYKEISKDVPGAIKIMRDEQRHEKEIVKLLQEERLKYVGSVVLGLNDALVELTGALAGLTLALQNSKLIAVTGLIMGIAASLSMAVSEYLSTKTESGGKNPLHASFYTGVAYVLTVLLLISPFFILKNVFGALALTVCNALFVIAFFNFYICVTKGVSFWKRFLEMALLSLGVAAISFGIGFLVRIFLHVEV